MAARVFTDSANGTVVLTSRETGFEVAATGGRGGRDLIMGADDDVNITSIKGYSPKVSCLATRDFQC